ncbi:MAG TPA: 7-carboxy-7-deazaguanine synthase QueE [Chromatiales bacterium]|nr:7-carboxy-7-deazaguanine synthase QueE [Thiotrichales bacterium]HIP68023.1 7-carboxy-7-deazaguanine synthase QueE [Chromatiales bacterium]
MTSDTKAPASQAGRLKVYEIFYSLQGEARSIGWPTVFVRLTGCPLRCQYCDTEYAFSGGQWMTLDEIKSAVQQYRTRHVTVTGGEPLAQKSCLDLLSELADLGLHVSLETSGAIDISNVDPRVVKVMDIKTPDSAESEKNIWGNLEYLSPRDQIKFVICSRSDYQWCKEKLKAFQLADRCEVLFSPSYDQLPASDLADWVLEDQLPVRFQIQLHKALWGDEPGR